MTPDKTPKEKLMDILGVDYKSYESAAKKVKVKKVSKPLDEPKDPLPIIKTGTVIDKILGGEGVEAGRVVEMYGEFGSGKTQIGFTLAVEADGLVIYVDAEGTFSRKRILEIAKARGKDVKEVNNKILVYQPEDWVEQEAVSYQLPEPPEGEKIALIIIDSLLCHWRSATEFQGREHLTKRQQLIRRHIKRFKDYAKRQGAVIFFTNQVYDVPDQKPFSTIEQQIKGVGGHTVRHIPDFVVILRKASGNVRIARLLDSSEIQLSEVAFQINERGVDDLPQESKEKAEKDLAKYADKHKSAIWGRKSPKKKGGKTSSEVKPKSPSDVEEPKEKEEPTEKGAPEG